MNRILEFVAIVPMACLGAIILGNESISGTDYLLNFYSVCRRCVPLVASNNQNITHQGNWEETLLCRSRWHDVRNCGTEDTGTTISPGGAVNHDVSCEELHAVYCYCEDLCDGPPTLMPTFSPSVSPTNEPSLGPSIHPSFAPSISPNTLPVGTPSANPTKLPSKGPSVNPSASPSNVPTNLPSRGPSANPTNLPSQGPSLNPTNLPSRGPSLNPTNLPSRGPSFDPSVSPSNSPTKSPSQGPSTVPSFSPSTSPNLLPTKPPTFAPSHQPTFLPSKGPSMSPTNLPTGGPSMSPTNLPTGGPSFNPTLSPSTNPTNDPTQGPSFNPTLQPTKNPTNDPTQEPSKGPSFNPTKSPTNDPTQEPSKGPSFNPTKSPTNNPTKEPTQVPSFNPTLSPTKNPTKTPTKLPTNTPTLPPTNTPTLPTNKPSASPTRIPTPLPSGAPTASPLPPISGTSFTFRQLLTLTSAPTQNRIPVGCSKNGIDLVAAYRRLPTTSPTMSFLNTYKRTGSYTWTRSPTLLTDPAGKTFGHIVCMSYDGNVIVTAFAGLDGDAAIIFRRPTVNDAYVKEASLVYSPWSSLYGPEAYSVACTLDATGSMVVLSVIDDGSGDYGSIQTYTYSSGTWTKDASAYRCLAAPTVDRCGSGLSVSHDGQWLIVGASAYNLGSRGGGIFILERSGGSWVERYAVSGLTLGIAGNFGVSVTMLGNGTYAAAGSTDWSSSRGAAAFFKRTGSTWSHLASYTNAGGLADNVGYRVALDYSPENDMVLGIVTAHWYNAQRGRVYVFNVESTGITRIQVIDPPTPIAGELFGAMIALCQSVLVVGPSGVGVNKVWVYTL